MLIAGIVFLLALFGAPVLGFFHDIYFFVRMTERAAAWSDSGKRAEAIALLEKVLRRKALLGDALKIPARFTLGKMYQVDARYREAAEQIETAIASMPEQGRDIGLEAECYLALYDVRLAQGLAEDADAALRRAEAVARIEPTSAGASTLWYEARGKLYELRGRYSDAVAEYRQAMEHAPANTPPVAHATTLLRIGIACYNAARYRESVEACHRVAGLNTSPQMTLMSLSQAVISAAALNELNRAEEYAEQLVMMAQSQGAPGGTLAQANLHFLQGEFDTALAKLNGLTLTQPGDRNIARGIQYEIAMACGEYEEALAFIVECLQEEPFPFPTIQRRSEATFHWARGRAYLELRDADRAWDAIDRATIVLGVEELFGLACEAMAIQADALQDAGDPALLVRLAELEKQVEQLQAERGDEWTATRDLRDIIGRAAFECGEWEFALRNFQIALAAGLRPVMITRVRYSEGECLRNLGREEEARESYHLAAETGLETLHARLARRRLLGGDVDLD